MPLFCLFVVLMAGASAVSRTAYFADGYHGGIYGHYPMWQAKFMVDKLNEYPDWKINLEIEPETWDVVQSQDPENFKRLQQYYQNTGRFGRIEFVNPAYAQPYCYNISGESIIRHFQYGMAKISEYFPDATFQTYSCEEPCFTSCLPQVLTSLGFEYAVLRNPDTCWGGYTSAFGNDLVNWNSSDGSSILTVPRYACEELVKGSTWQTASWNNSRDFIKACFDSGVQYPVGMCFQDAGWRHGPWLENVIRRYYQPTEYVTWTDYIEMVAPKVKPADWDFTIEDVKPGLVWGAQVLQKLAQEIRYTENRLVMAEKMAAYDSLYNGTSYPQTQFDQAWRNLMLSQHHDCWIVPYNGRRGDTWADKVMRWTAESNQIADKIITDAFGHISAQQASDARYITVFNTLGISRTELASVTLPEGIDPQVCQVYSLDGKPVRSQVLTSDDNRRLIFEASAPAIGYSTYRIVEKQSQSNQITARQLEDHSIQIETNNYTAVIDPAKGGTITSLVAKNLGNHQLVEGHEGLNNLRGYFYNDQKFISGADEPAKVTIVENGSIFIRLKIEGRLAENPYTQWMTFYQDNPRIDYELNIEWKTQPGIGAYSQEDNYVKEKWPKAFYNDKYKLQIRFPLKGVGDKLYKNAPFDVCQSRLENTYYGSWDAIKHNVILNWVDICDQSDSLGVALFSDHTTSYINSQELPLGLTAQYIGRALWGRNYNVEGPTHIRYAVLPHKGKWDEYGIHAQSTAWNEPLLAMVTKMKPLSPDQSLTAVETKGIEVTSMVKDENALLVRLFNAEADSEKATMTIHCVPDKIELIQLNGQVIKEITPVVIGNTARKFELEIPRFGVRTIRLSNPRIPPVQ